MQCFDQHFLADARFPIDQNRNVLFQHELRLANYLMNLRVALVDACKVQGARGFGCCIPEITRLDQGLLRASNQAMKTVITGCS